MKQIGYRITRQRENIYIIRKVIHVVAISNVIDYHIFYGRPFDIFPDDELEVAEETIKAGRHIKDCIGYATKSGKFDTFLVRLI